MSLKSLLTSKAEKKRQEEALNSFKSKYPLTEECTAMQSELDAANVELDKLYKQPTSSSGEKHVRSRNIDALKGWIGQMEGYIKDLTCGIQIAPAPAPLTLPPVTSGGEPTVVGSGFANPSEGGVMTGQATP